MLFKGLDCVKIRFVQFLQCNVLQYDFELLICNSSWGTCLLRILYVLQRSCSKLQPPHSIETEEVRINQSLNAKKENNKTRVSMEYVHAKEADIQREGGETRSPLFVSGEEFSLFLYIFWFNRCHVVLYIQDIRLYFSILLHCLQHKYMQYIICNTPTTSPTS
jgi:hypothetical protein